MIFIIQCIKQYCLCDLLNIDSVSQNNQAKQCRLSLIQVIKMYIQYSSYGNSLIFRQQYCASVHLMEVQFGLVYFRFVQLIVSDAFIIEFFEHQVLFLLQIFVQSSCNPSIINYKKQIIINCTQDSYYVIINLFTMKCDKCTKNDAVARCQKCQYYFCFSCLRLDLLQSNHANQTYYFCQECQEVKADKFCFSCDQLLCDICNSRIHNKGKRALHIVQKTDCSRKFQILYVVLILADFKNNIEDGYQLFLTLCQKLTFDNSDKEFAIQNIHLLFEDTPNFQIGSFSYTQLTHQNINDEYITEYCKYFPLLSKVVLLDSVESRKLKSRLSMETILICTNQFQSRNNLSISTQNQSISKSKKSPIAYFQFYKLSKEDSRSEIQLKMRKFASEGILILKRNDIAPMQGIVRSFIRTIGDAQIQYCALQISYISIESLIWVIRSIKQDLMTPGEKLILSRIKQSFDIKLHSKFWQSILNFLGSNRYQMDYDKGIYGFTLPKIILSKHNDETILLLKNQEWKFEDQQKLDESSQAWKDFIKFLLQYFEKNKNIPGGRYGCVQFVKMFGPESLRHCSLGKLSLYVQEAINKGLIRYHKTLLIKNIVEQHHKSFTESSSMQEGDYSFSFNEKSIYILQKQLKVKTLQINLINILLQNQQGYSISLAQIPLFLKKTISFNLNLPELGFPKLKNLILTLNDIIQIQINKSVLNYSFYRNSEFLINTQKEKLPLMAAQFLNIIKDAINRIVRYFNIIVVDDLYNELNIKIGFEFDFRIFNAPDFCHFLYYYCNESIHIEFVSGVFMAYFKQTHYLNTHQKPIYQQNPETSTPNFCNSFDSGVKISYKKFPDVFYFTNQFEQKQKKQQSIIIPQENDLIQNLKFVQDLLNDDDHASQTTYKTVIQNQNIVNKLDWSISNLIITQDFVNTNNTKTNHIKALSEDFDIAKKHMNKHNRVMSTVQQKDKSNKE